MPIRAAILESIRNNELIGLWTKNRSNTGPSA